MATHVLTDSRGFTLLEFLVAVMILSVGILGLLQAVNIAISHNMKNQLRQEGVVVADGVLAKELAKGGTATSFEAISTTTKSFPVNRNVMNGFRNYSVTMEGSEITANTRRVIVVVTWRYKKERFQHGASALISKTQQ